MKRIATLIIISLFIYAATAQNINKQKLDSLFLYIDKADRAIGSISIMKNGENIYDYTFGGKHTKGVSTPQYRVGSITKTITAILTFLLIENDQLSLDSKLGEYFPDMPNAENITVNHLLDHTSGLKNFALKEDSLFYWLLDPVEEADILKEIKRQGVGFSPGEKTSYSNSGYYLLTKIIEKVSGEKYPQLIKEQITKPLNLKNTISGQKTVGNVLESYELNTNNQWTQIKDFHFPNVIGLGDIASSPQELNTIITALFAEKIINKNNISLMMPSGKQRFGSGMMSFPFYEQIFYGHGGDSFGSHSTMMYNPKDSIAVSACFNGMAIAIQRQKNDILAGAISIIYDTLLNYPTFPKNYQDCNVDMLKEYTGDYSAKEYGMELKILIRNNNLFARMAGQPELMLQAQSPTIFGNTKVGFSIEFFPNENKLVITQGSAKLSFNRRDKL